MNHQAPDTPRWRWEKFDFDNSQVHVSCPICYALTRAPIDDRSGTIRCSQANCTFSGAIQHDGTAEAQYEEWKHRTGSSGAGIVDKLTWNPIAVV